MGKLTSDSETIHLQNVVFGYNPCVPVLRVDELVVDAGKRVFVYGPSGCGKTTLLGLITGVLRPQQGNCRVLGIEMTKISASARDRLRGAQMPAVETY